MTNLPVTNPPVTNLPITIIILNWNRPADTLACLESLRASGAMDYEAVVVDNGSSDGSAALIQEQWPEAVVIENGRNLGYAGGNNVGLRYALGRGARYVLLLNDDARVGPGMLERLLEAAEEDNTIGAVGPTICYADTPDTVWTAGGAIDWRRGRTWMVGLDERDGGQFGTAPREVDFISGCVMLLRREAVERAGWLDERFFVYYEEAEWCVRARRAGFRIVHVPLARAWHRISPRAQEDSPVVHYYMTRNRLLFLRLTGAGAQAWLHTGAEYARTLLAWSLRPRWRHKRAQRRAMVQALADAGRGRWGPMRT